MAQLPAGNVYGNILPVVVRLDLGPDVAQVYLVA